MVKGQWEKAIALARWRIDAQKHPKRKNDTKYLLRWELSVLSLRGGATREHAGLPICLSSR